MVHNPYLSGDASGQVESAQVDTPVVCLLAKARRGPYWVDVAPSLRAMDALARTYTLREVMPGEEVTARDVVLVAWYEACASLSDAEGRADELRKCSPLWQRGLIEHANPQWLDMGGDAVGFPTQFLTTLPESVGMPHRPVSEL